MSVRLFLLIALVVGALAVPSGAIPAQDEVPPPVRPRPLRFAAPALGQLESGFGVRWGREHTGLDIANASGTPVVASESGRVREVAWRGAYGLTVEVVHRDGYATLYAHLADATVVEGASVTRGQRLGAMGATGNATGTHVHFEVWRLGVPVDPAPLLAAGRARPGLKVL